MCTGGGQRAVFGGWGRVSFIFPFLSLPPISRWASWGRMLSYLMCISGVNLRLSSLQTLCFSPTESFHQHHCWAGDSATYLLDSADRVENPMYRLSWSGRLCGLALCMHQKSTQAMVSDSSSFFALHSNFSFSGGIEKSLFSDVSYVGCSYRCTTDPGSIFLLCNGTLHTPSDYQLPIALSTSSLRNQDSTLLLLFKISHGSGSMCYLVVPGWIMSVAHTGLSRLRQVVEFFFFLRLSSVSLFVCVCISYLAYPFTCWRKPRSLLP